uniref:Uncharacterized protein n=1 Tax=Arundo donax TaxID=35708 RepID=A0A0A8Z4K8_ARUDO
MRWIELSVMNFIDAKAWSLQSWLAFHRADQNYPH